MACFPSTSFCLLQFSHQNAPYSLAPEALSCLAISMDSALESEVTWYGVYGTATTLAGSEAAVAGPVGSEMAPATTVASPAATPETPKSDERRFIMYPSSDSFGSLMDMRWSIWTSMSIGAVSTSLFCWRWWTEGGGESY